MSNFVMLALPLAAVAKVNLQLHGKGCCNDITKTLPEFKSFDGPPGNFKSCWEVPEVADCSHSDTKCGYVTVFPEDDPNEQREHKWCTVLNKEPTEAHEGYYGCDTLDDQDGKCGSSGAGGVETYISTTPMKVIIKYTFNNLRNKAGLAVSQQIGDCIIDHYRLIFKDNHLALVGVDLDENPCDKDFEGGHWWWEWSSEGLFSDERGDKSCLMADYEHKLTTNSAGAVDCSSHNKMYFKHPGGWHFNQGGIGIKLCMQDVPDANGAATVVYTLPVLQKGECSEGWHMEVFNGADQTLTLQSDLPPTSLESCCTTLGNFACYNAKENVCQLVPTESDCTEDLKGEWCAEPASYPVCTAAGLTSPPQDTFTGDAERRDCSQGCSFDICEQKMRTHPKLAIKHCYTQFQVDNGAAFRGPPRGCDYGTAENTCAYDDKDQCVYSDLGSLMTV